MIPEPPWRFDHAELNRIARDAWGVKAPVRLRRRSRRWDRRTGRPTVRRDAGGWASWRPELGEHHVLVVNTSCIESMLRTLAHELEHCAQAERMGPALFTGVDPSRRFPSGRYWTLYRADQEGWERLAQAAEERWRELLPAVKVRQHE